MSGEIETMKICKYCGSENTDEAKTCASCGAKEFNYKCENCGTLLLDGNFCPKCGVKYGTKSKKCPRCGAEYYSNACPDCGYRNSNHGNTSQAGMVANSIQKRKTWLWILGWIFIFPVPLTVLVSKNEKLNKWTKIGIITVAWIMYLALAMVGSLNKDQNEPLSSEHTRSQPSISEEIAHNIVSSQPVISSREETEVFVFAEDHLVNRFISESNKI